MTRAIDKRATRKNVNKRARERERLCIYSATVPHCHDDARELSQSVASFSVHSAFFGDESSHARIHAYHARERRCSSNFPPSAVRGSLNCRNCAHCPRSSVVSHFLFAVDLRGEYSQRV